MAAVAASAARLVAISRCCPGVLRRRQASRPGHNRAPRRDTSRGATPESGTGPHRRSRRSWRSVSLKVVRFGNDPDAGFLPPWELAGHGAGDVSRGRQRSGSGRLRCRDKMHSINAAAPFMALQLRKSDPRDFAIGRKRNSPIDASVIEFQFVNIGAAWPCPLKRDGLQGSEACHRPFGRTCVLPGQRRKFGGELLVIDLFAVEFRSMTRRVAAPAAGRRGLIFGKRFASASSNCLAVHH